jgi:hypothetical protein
MRGVTSGSFSSWSWRVGHGLVARKWHRSDVAEPAERQGGAVGGGPKLAGYLSRKADQEECSRTKPTTGATSSGRGQPRASGGRTP